MAQEQQYAWMLALLVAWRAREDIDKLQGGDGDLMAAMTEVIGICGRFRTPTNLAGNDPVARLSGNSTQGGRGEVVIGIF